MHNENLQLPNLSKIAIPLLLALGVFLTGCRMDFNGVNESILGDYPAAQTPPEDFPPYVLDNQGMGD